MNDQTEFHLDRAIQQWRDHLAQSPAFRDENLNELESHLRDSIGALQARGLSAEEALMVAVKRIGGGDSLKSEFGKINGQLVWLDRALWLLLGAQLWIFVISMTGTVSRTVMGRMLGLLDFDFKAHAAVVPVSLFMIANLMVFAASLFFCWWLVREKGKNLGPWVGRLLQRRSGWVVSFFVLALLFVANYLINGFEVRSLMRRSAGEQIIMSISVASHLSNIIQFVVILAVTLLLARRRFQSIVGCRMPQPK